MSGDVWCGVGTHRMQDKAKVCGVDTVCVVLGNYLWLFVKAL